MLSFFALCFIVYSYVTVKTDFFWIIFSIFICVLQQFLILQCSLLSVPINLLVIFPVEQLMSSWIISTSLQKIESASELQSSLLLLRLYSFNNILSLTVHIFIHGVIMNRISYNILKLQPLIISELNSCVLLCESGSQFEGLQTTSCRCVLLDQFFRFSEKLTIKRFSFYILLLHTFTVFYNFKALIFLFFNSSEMIVCYF